MGVSSGGKFVLDDNSDGRLLPYLTANLLFEVNRRENVLLVPNTALTWKPPAELIAPEFRDAAAKRGLGGAGARSGAGRPTTAATSAPTSPSTKGILWVKDGNFVKPLRVTRGPTDNVVTEVSGADLQEGVEVVIGTEVAGARGPGGTTNPFMPQPFGQRRPQQ